MLAFTCELVGERGAVGISLEDVVRVNDSDARIGMKVVFYTAESSRDADAFASEPVGLILRPPAPGQDAR